MSIQKTVTAAILLALICAPSVQSATANRTLDDGTVKSDLPQDGKKKHPGLLKPAKANAKCPGTYKVLFDTTKGKFVMEVTKTFDREDPYGRVSGIAEVREVSQVRGDLIGKRVYFLLKSEDKVSHLAKGAVVRATGLLKARSASSNHGFEIG